MALASQHITLDTTLKQLYSLDGGSDRDIVLVYAVPTADVQMTSGVPLSSKFVYQSPLSHVEDSDELARLFLQVVPQLFGFIAGKMPLILFDLEHDHRERPQNQLSFGSERANQVDAFRVFDQLSPSQRPQVTFVVKAQDIVLFPGAQIAIASPMDCMLHLPHAVEPEAHYELLSKRALALSGLPTPGSKVIDTLLQPYQIPNERLVDAEVIRMVKPIRERPLPFAVKMPQALSGQGTFLIHTESDSQKAVEVLAREVKRMLHQLNDSNKNLQPCSLVVQDLIPGDTAALSLFVTKTGRPIFTSCTEQIMDAAGHWGGAFISYEQQDHLEKVYAQIMGEMAQYVHQKGYYGPMNADVMTSPDGRHLIVDLNVRVAGSHPLGFLKNHFSVDRNLPEAVLFFPLCLKGTRVAFEREFERNFRDGSLIIAGWCPDKSGINSISSVILAAETTEKLRSFIDEVNLHKLPE